MNIEKNGISCPICNKDLYDTTTSDKRILPNGKTGIAVHCGYCDYEAFREISLVDTRYEGAD